jgi:DNA-binding transcriptional ArsR family regulator
VANETFSLEHFYYGQAVVDGKPSGEAQVLATSPGIDDALAQHAVDRLDLPPLIRAKNASWAFVRGRSRQAPFLMVQAQQGAQGQYLSHYIIIPMDTARVLGGNLDAMRLLLADDFPVFDKPGRKLERIGLDAPEPLTIDAQVDHILELMMITKNRIPLLQSLLSAIVETTPLVIQGAPADLDERVLFIQGLLALLPPSARFGVTFTTHSLPTTTVDAQIRFYSDDAPPASVMIFNWADARISGVEADNAYSRYVMSQLRLDAELVIQHNMAMAAIAGWRLNQGDDLATSLGYASTRLKVDSSLRNNQPVNKEEVSRILAEDPTLSEDLQVLYGLHLIRFTLAMYDMEPAMPVAILLRTNTRLEQSALDELTKTLSDDTADLIYETLLRWMNNPLGPQGTQWVNLTHRATLIYLQGLVNDSYTEDIIDTLKELQDAGPTLRIDELTPKIIKLLLPLSYRDAQIAENLFLLGVRHLQNDPFHQMMSLDRFRSQLNPQIERGWRYIASGVDDAQVSSAAVVKAAKGYGERWEALILVRFADIAQRLERFKLLDNDMLKALYDLTQWPDASDHFPRIREVAATVDKHLMDKLQPPGPRYLLQIHLATGAYERLANGMRLQLRRYPPDDQEAYLAMVATLFTEAAIPEHQVRNVMGKINAAGVRSAPWIVAAISAVQQHLGSPEVVPLVDRVAEEIASQRHIMDIVPADGVLGLLDHYTTRKDIDGIRLLSGAIPIAINKLGTKGIKRVTRTYSRLNWDKEARDVGMDILRSSVRMNNSERSRKIVAYYGKQIGAPVQQQLEVTYIIQRLLGHRRLELFAEDLNRAVVFLHQFAELYADPKLAPSLGALQDGIGALSGAGGVRPAAMREMLDDMMFVGRGLVQLGRQQQSGSKRNNASTPSLALGKADPSSTVDVLVVMSGALVDGMHFGLNLDAPVKRYPLEDFSLGQLITEFEVVRQILRPMLKALPLNKPPTLKATQIVSEMHSLDRSLEIDMKNVLLRNAARDLQYFAELVTIAYDTSDAKAFEDSGLAKRIDAGKHKPRGMLELMRFIYGYYDSKS